MLDFRFVCRWHGPRQCWRNNKSYITIIFSLSYFSRIVFRYFNLRSLHYSNLRKRKSNSYFYQRFAHKLSSKKKFRKYISYRMVNIDFIVSILHFVLTLILLFFSRTIPKHCRPEESQKMNSESYTRRGIFDPLIKNKLKVANIIPEWKYFLQSETP